VSKQMCDKPIASSFWTFDEVAGHWDSLIMRSFIYEDGKRVLYQEGTVASMLDPQTLIDGLDEKKLPEGTMMFCGTFAAKGGIRPASRFEFEIEDPVLKRKIEHGYDIKTLPVVG
jgi:hypothetical protein